jgi:drug/metabolite transporter (DMT)-like permease
MRKGSVVATLSAVCFASGVVFIRFAYQSGMLPGTAVFIRPLIAVTVLFLVLRLSGQWVSLPKDRIIPLFLLGLVAYTALGITWFEALDMIPAWLVALVLSSFPLCVTISSWIFLKEPVQRQHIIALASVLCGTVILFGRPFGHIVWGGVVLILLNVLINTAYVLVGQRWTREIPPYMSTLWMIIGTAVGTACYATFTGQISFSFAPIGWLWIGLSACVTSVLAIMTMWWGIGIIGPSRTAIIGTLEIPFSVILSVLVLGETMAPAQIVGGVFILVGALVVQYRAGGRPAPPPEPWTGMSGDV